MFIFAAMIVLHSASGVEIDVNSREVTNLRRPETGSNFSKNVKCQVNFTDGKFITVIETCDEVRRIMEKSK